MTVTIPIRLGYYTLSLVRITTHLQLRVDDLALMKLNLVIGFPVTCLSWWSACATLTMAKQQRWIYVAE